MSQGITVIGGCTQDIMFYTGDMEIVPNRHNLLRHKLIAFEYGAKIHSPEVYFTFGGGGANIAVNLASLGIKTKLISAVGADALGRDILANLRAKGVDVRGIKIAKGINSGLSFVVNVGKDKEHVLFAYRGANEKLALGPHIISSIRTPWVFLSTTPQSCQRQLPYLFDYCRRKKIYLFWNPSEIQIKFGWRRLARLCQERTILIVNRTEALELAASVSSAGLKNNIPWLFKTLHRKQTLTVITDGAKGAYVYDGQRTHFSPAIQVKAVNTLGAGDAFGAALAAGLIKFHWDLARALQLAMLNSSAVVSRIGAQAGIMTRADLRRRNL